MIRVRTFIATCAFGLSTAFSITAFAGTPSIELLFSGMATPNQAPAPQLPAFAAWCQSRCFPTTQQPVYDPSTGVLQGTINVWGRDFAYGAGGASLCFSEFISFTLYGGTIYVHSPDKGTCGGAIDPSLKPPLHQDLGATVVIAGGGDGQIVGGTGRYQAMTGTYTDRVFVGFGAPTSGVGGIVYYDQLWFSISGQ